MFTPAVGPAACVFFATRFHKLLVRSRHAQGSSTLETIWGNGSECLFVPLCSAQGEISHDMAVLKSGEMVLVRLASPCNIGGSLRHSLPVPLDQIKHHLGYFCRGFLAQSHLCLCLFQSPVDRRRVVLCFGHLVVLEMQRPQRDDLCYLRCVLDVDYFPPHQVRGAPNLAFQYVFAKTDRRF